MSKAKYPRLDLGTIEAVVNKLGGMEGLGRFLRGETSVVASIPNRWPIWGNVALGTEVKTGIDFCDRLGGNHVSQGAEVLLKMPDFKESIAEVWARVNLVGVTVAELGFDHSATYQEICQRAIERGLSLCSAEVGPQLCLQYWGQLDNKWDYVIAMEAITDTNNRPRLFHVEKNPSGVTFLSFSAGDPQEFYGVKAQFLFQCHNCVKG